MAKLMNVVVNLMFEGVHNWPDCPFPEVDFLKHPHRHIFHITCKKEVTHTDRDIEIILLKRRIETFLILNNPNGYMGSSSCEMVADKLMSGFDLNYCQVLEDGENGAEIWLT